MTWPRMETKIPRVKSFSVTFTPTRLPLTYYIIFVLIFVCVYVCRSQWLRGLRRRSAASRLLRSWVRIPPGAWMFISCECCVFSGRGLCDELITRPEESYRLWWVVVCDIETSRMRSPWPALSCSATAKKKCVCVYMLSLNILHHSSITIQYQQH